jgi:hypothetical protein
MGNATYRGERATARNGPEHTSSNIPAKIVMYYYIHDVLARTKTTAFVLVVCVLCFIAFLSMQLSRPEKPDGVQIGSMVFAGMGIVSIIVKLIIDHRYWDNHTRLKEFHIMLRKMNIADGDINAHLVEAYNIMAQHWNFDTNTTLKVVAGDAELKKHMASSSK